MFANSSIVYLLQHRQRANSMSDSDKLSLIANIAASYLRRNSIGVDQIATVMSSVTDAVEQASRKLAGTTAEEASSPSSADEKPRPAVAIKKSVQPEHIV